jgi:outer membrane autotransporter protein
MIRECKATGEASADFGLLHRERSRGRLPCLRRLSLLSTTIIAGLALPVSPGQADSTWMGGSSNDWGDAGNWVGDGVPNAVDAVATFPGPGGAGSGVGVFGGSSPFTIGTLNIYGSSSGSGYLFNFGTLRMEASSGQARINVSTSNSAFASFLTMGIRLVSDTTVNIGADSDFDIGGGGISGGGRLTKTGAGVLMLTGANTYTGGTTISAGTINIGNMSALGPGGVVLQNDGRLNSTVTGSFVGRLTFALASNATVSAAAGQTLSLDGDVFFNDSSSGIASIHFGTIADTGTVVLGGGNHRIVTFTSSIGVDGGTLRLAAGRGDFFTSNAFGGTSVASGATLDINGNATVRLLSGAGTVLNDNGAAATLTANNNADSLFAGGIRDGAGTLGLDKTGAGTLTLTGHNAHTGGTLVSQGELRLDGTLGSGAVTVASAGTLSGTGSIAGPVTVGGTLSAGHSPGTLSVGSLVLNSGATSVFELNSPGVVGGSDPVAGNDLVRVTGNLTLGGRLDARVAAAGYYRLFDYGGTLAGSFASQSATSTTAGFSIASAGVETGIAGQVNLAVLGIDQAMQFWDGTNTVASGSVNGGAGSWASFGTNWTTSTGSANAGWGGSVGVFAGSTGGAVTVAGTQSFDTLQFSTNGYTLSGGTLAIAPASGTLSTFNIDGGVSVSIDSTIADGGGAGIEKVGRGTLTLTGLNTYTGGTTISQGTLEIVGIQPLGTGAVTLNGGTLRMADCGCGSIVLSNDVVLSATGGTLDTGGGELAIGGNIRGGGALTITGSGGPMGGYVVFGGNNTYSGPTRITADGILLAVTPTALSPNSDYTVDGILDPGGFDATLRSLSGAASGRIGSSVVDPVTLTVAGGGIFDGVILNGGTGPLSLVKTGTGTLTLNGQNTYTGATTVEGGTLVVGGAGQGGASLAGTVTLKDGGTLGGVGTIGGLSVASGGTVAPGNSIGILKISGDVALGVGAFYAVEIDPTGASDRIVASGRATLSGGTVVVGKAPGSYAPSTRYTILTAAGEVSGAFAGLTQNLPFIDFGLSYDPGNVYLDVVRNQVSFPSVGLTRNQIATGIAVEALGQGNTLHDAVVQQASAGAARGAFDALSGEIHASAKTALVEESGALRSATIERLRSAFGAVGAPPMATMNYGFTADLAPSAAGPMPALRSERFAAWGQGSGSWGSSDADGNAGKLTRSTGGFLIGADIAALDTLRIGVLAGYSRSEFKANGRLSSGESDNYDLGLYGGGQWGALGIRAGASYTWHDVETRRTAAFAGFGNGLKSDYSAGTAQVFGELGYRTDLGRVALEPFAGLAYVNLHSDGFAETGGAAVLTASDDDTSLGYSTLGLRASTSLALQGRELTVRGGLAWRHAFGDVDPEAALAFAGGNPFSVAGIPIAKKAALLEAGIDLAIGPGASLGVSYIGQLAADTQDHGFKANLAVRF